MHLCAILERALNLLPRLPPDVLPVMQGRIPYTIGGGYARTVHLHGPRRNRLWGIRDCSEDLPSTVMVGMGAIDNWNGLLHDRQGG